MSDTEFEIVDAQPENQLADPNIIETLNNEIYNIVEAHVDSEDRHTGAVEPGTVDPVQEHGRGFSGNAGSNRSTGIQLRGSTRTIEISREELYRTIISEIRRNHLRQRVVHSVYRRNEPYDQCDAALDRAIQRAFNGTLFIIARHGNHYHVVHDCNWSSSSCRCARVRDIEHELRQFNRERTRYNRTVTRTSTWSIHHWINLIEYMSTATRAFNAVEISGDWWIRYHRGEYRTLFEAEGFRAERAVEGLRLQDEIRGDDCDGRDLYPGHEDGAQHCDPITAERQREEDCVSQASGSSDGRPGTSASVDQYSYGNTAKKKENLFAFFQRIVFSPPKMLFQSRLWLRSEFRFIDKRKTYFQITFEQLKLFYVEKTMLEIWNHLLDVDPIQLYFASEDTDAYYYTIKESVFYLEALLMFQYNNNINDIENFLKDIYNICDKVMPKRNTLFILGEPNSGKNFFFDAVVHSMVNFGIITNWNRHNQFPLQDCPNRRVLFWNEPNFEDGVEETLKLLFGGDQCGARIKYEGDAIIRRTPVIVLSNNDCFPKNDAFRTRLVKHVWKRCDALRSLTKKPYPIAIYYLMARWNIIDYKNIVYTFSDEDLCIFHNEIQL